jgi:hypothetical protein
VGLPSGLEPFATRAGAYALVNSSFPHHRRGDGQWEIQADGKKLLDQRRLAFVRSD